MSLRALCEGGRWRDASALLRKETASAVSDALDLTMKLFPIARDVVYTDSFVGIARQSMKKVVELRAGSSLARLYFACQDARGKDARLDNFAEKAREWELRKQTFVPLLAYADAVQAILQYTCNKALALTPKKDEAKLPLSALRSVEFSSFSGDATSRERGEKRDRRDREAEIPSPFEFQSSMALSGSELETTPMDRDELTPEDFTDALVVSMAGDALLGQVLDATETERLLLILALPFDDLQRRLVDRDNYREFIGFCTKNEGKCVTKEQILAVQSAIARVSTLRKKGIRDQNVGELPDAAWAKETLRKVVELTCACSSRITLL